MGILDWVYQYPGTLEALLERDIDADDIMRMSTKEALAVAASSRVELTPEQMDLVSPAHILYESVKLRKKRLSL